MVVAVPGVRRWSGLSHRKLHAHVHRPRQAGWPGPDESLCRGGEHRPNSGSVVVLTARPAGLGKGQGAAADLAGWCGEPI